MTQVTGRAYVDIPGYGRLRTKEGASLETGGVKRDAAMSDSGVDGYVETNVTPQIDCVISHTAAISLTAIHAVKDQSIIFVTDTNRSFTLKGGWSSTPPKLAKGEVTLQFQGTECIEG